MVSEDAILEELILDDLRSWVQLNVLGGDDMYDHLDLVEENLGEAAREKELDELMQTYFSDHILKI
jgi:hypothetical protein